MAQLEPNPSALGATILEVQAMTASVLRAARLLFAVELCGVLQASVLFGQMAESQKPSGLILGQVVDAGSNKPVPGAVVTITSSATGAGWANVADEVMAATTQTQGVTTLRVTADTSGRFLFRDL